MKIAIIGSGGVGGYFGAKLAHSGFDVSFLARGEHLKAMQTNGLLIKSIHSDFHVRDISATDRISDIGQADLIVMGIKAWQVREIRDDLKKIIHAGSMILPLQNGILAADELRVEVDRANVLGGLCRIISKIESPGVINHFGAKPTIVFGELDQAESKRTLALKKVFDKAGIDAIVSNDIIADLWKKFIFICVSGLMAVSRTSYGELREMKQTRQMMIALLNEIYLLSQKVGVQIEADFIDKTVTFIDTLPYESTFSLARDVWEGRPSEIDYQNGAVVRLAEQYGVDTPINRFIYHCILPMEQKARGVRLKS